MHHFYLNATCLAKFVHRSLNTNHPSRCAVPCPEIFQTSLVSYQVKASSLAPVTAIQFGANKAFDQLARSVFGEDFSHAGKIGIAAAAGAASSLASCPAEIIMIQQQGSGRSLFAEAKHFLQCYRPRTLFRALVRRIRGKVRLGYTRYTRGFVNGDSDPERGFCGSRAKFGDAA